MIVKRIVPIFDIQVQFATDFEEASAWCKKKDPGSEVALEKAMGVAHVFHDKNDTIWRLLAVFDGCSGTLAHEAVHMAWRLLNDVGIRVSVYNNQDEPLAFLAGWLVSEFMRAFPNAQFKANPKSIIDPSLKARLKARMKREVK